MLDKNDNSKHGRVHSLSHKFFAILAINNYTGVNVIPLMLWISLLEVNGIVFSSVYMVFLTPSTLALFIL